MQFKFQPKSSIHAEVINILVNPRWRRPPSWIFKISHFWIITICTWLFYIFLFNLAIFGQCIKKWHRDIQCFYLHWKCPTTPFLGTFGVKHPKFQKFKILTPKGTTSSGTTSYGALIVKIGRSRWSLGVSMEEQTKKGQTFWGDISPLSRG